MEVKVVSDRVVQLAKDCIISSSSTSASEAFKAMTTANGFPLKGLWEKTSICWNGNTAILSCEYSVDQPDALTRIEFLSSSTQNKL